MSRRGQGRRKLPDDGWGGFRGYMDAKVQKLEQQFLKEGASKDERLSNIMSGVAVHVNGYTNPSSSEIKRLMQQHGGSFIHYYTRSKVTHIIASNLPNSKISNLHDKKVVKPDWIVDSVKAGKLLPYQDYLLYGAKNKFQPGMQTFGQTENKTCSTSSLSFVECSCDEELLETSTEDVSSQKLKSTTENKHDSNSTKTDDTLTMLGITNEPTTATHAEDTDREHDASIETDLEAQNSDDHQRSSEKKNANVTSTSTGTSTSSAAIENKKDSDILSINKQSPSKGSKTVGKAGQPNFLSEFYSNSRLHYLSTWGAELKAFMTALVEQGLTEFPARDKLQKIVSSSHVTSGQSYRGRLIMHVDMDCFFVTVGLLNRPHLAGKPVAVAHAKNPGAEESGSRQPETSTKSSWSEIASCSYEARKLGVKNGMLLGKAVQFCPQLITMPYDFESYKQVSETLYQTLSSYTLDIEAVSCDEVLVDCTSLMKATGAEPHQIAAAIREDIVKNTKCTASAGMGPNILVARMATRSAKPNGQHLVQSDEVERFMRDKPVRDLPGVGWRIGKRLKNLNIDTCADLQNLTQGALEKEFGPKTGLSLYKYCRGQDDRSIQTIKERKSVSAEVNYGMRFTKDDEAYSFLKELSAEVSQRLQKVKSKGQQVTLKLKVRRSDQPMETAKFMGHGICDSIARTSNLLTYTDDSNKIYGECANILQQLKVAAQDIRGMGIQLSKLNGSTNQASMKGNIMAYATKLPKTVPSSSSEQQHNKQSDNVIIASSVTDEQLCPAQVINIPESTTADFARSGCDGEKTDCKTPKSLKLNANVQSDTEEIDDDLQLSPVIGIIPSTPISQLIPPFPTFPLSGELTSTPRILQPVDLSEEPALEVSVSEFDKKAPTYKDEPRRIPSPIPASRRTRSVQPGPSGSVLTQSDHSFSQVNPEVLKHLPADIQNEIISAWSRKLNVNRKDDPGVCEPSDPGESAGEEGDVEDEDEEADVMSYTLFNADGKPCLCGASELPDIKDLLREWINLTPVPASDDMDRIIQFLNATVTAKNLENVYLIMKFLNRLLKKKDCQEWTNCFHTISESVQTYIQTIYGSRLKLN